MTDPPRNLAQSITPFDAEGGIDEALLRAHLRRMAAAGMGVYLGSPGGGEGHSLTNADYETLYGVGVDEVGGKVAVWATGFEPRTASKFIEVARIAEAAGVGAIGVYPVDAGHLMRPTPREQECYYREILDQMRLPVVMLTMEDTVGYKLPLPLLERLVAAYDNIFAVLMYDSVYLTEAHRTFGTRLKIYAGGANVLNNLAFGGHGFSGSEANIVPRLCRSIVDLWLRGEHGRSAAAYVKLMGLSAALAPLAPSIARPVKTALSILGLPAGHLRRPYLAAEPELEERLAARLRELDLLELEESAGLD
ncbi:MAG TPA: dihydrodipicolinate synthase family protein [Candidatus Dormibacteraeota bacterium]|jgi:4-hydroxy-tetrahydrodipicolinate synthase|nr:dihydrodipicolinate synthase family protein [Candidatus Dormibacteraeota bacterium]